MHISFFSCIVITYTHNIFYVEIPDDNFSSFMLMFFLVEFSITDLSLLILLFILKSFNEP